MTDQHINFVDLTDQELDDLIEALPSERPRGGDVFGRQHRQWELWHKLRKEQRDQQARPNTTCSKCSGDRVIRWNSVAKRYEHTDNNSEFCYPGTSNIDHDFIATPTKEN